MRAFHAVARAAVALMLVVVAASAWIRLGSGTIEVGLARGVHRVAATLTALLVIALAVLGWRKPGVHRVLLGALVLTVALSAIGLATGTHPPPAAALANQLGGLLLAALLAWLLGRAGGGAARPDRPLAVAALVLGALQAAFGGTLANLAADAPPFVFIAHAASGLAAAALLAALGWQLAAKHAPLGSLLIASALAAPGAGLCATLLGESLLAPAGHALSAALLLCAAAHALGRATPIA